MPERPRILLDTKTTNSVTYVTLVEAKVSPDCKGISYLDLSIDPDPNALYRMRVAKLLDLVDLEITAIWTVELPHLTNGAYRGFEAGDTIIVQHKTKDAAITVKTGISLAFNEVVCD